MKQLLSKLHLVLTAIFMMACSNEEVDAEPVEDGNQFTGSKTLVVYYSYTNHTEEIVADLREMINADVIEVEPEEKGLDFSANNYAIGSAQLSKINNNPEEASSYPSIDPINVDMSQYSTVIIATPLWWSQMATYTQTFLFKYGKEMEGKNIGLIVSSHSSGISGVEADAKRLVPAGNFMDKSLWINNSNHPKRRTLIEQWLKDINFSDLEEKTSAMNLNVNGHNLTVELTNNSSTEALLSLLEKGPITYEANDYGNFEKVGEIAYTLPQNDEQITTQPGDVILYQGNNICLYYGTNTWEFTRLGRVLNISGNDLKEMLGDGKVTITLSLPGTTGLNTAASEKIQSTHLYDINGRVMTQIPESGFYIENGQKKIK